MWIRNQNKEVLIKCKNIQIDKIEEGIFNIGVHFGAKVILLGNYVTKERALEVLDEIQYEIIRYDSHSNVYQMPEN